MTDTALVHKVISGGQGPRLLITAGVHGDEFEPMAAVRKLMASVRAEDIRGTLTLVPVVNVAAFLRGERTAEDGLDLARVCPGKAEGSVTHQTARALSAMIRAADFYIDLHTGGKALTLVALAGYMLHADGRVLELQRRMARAFNVPLVWGTTPNLEGRSLSAARDANVPAIYVEHGGGTELNVEAVRDLVDGCLNVMGAIGMMDRAVVRKRLVHVVEDAREQSGYLQINYPSPMDGVFEPAVAAGAVVKRNGLLGKVWDPVGGAELEVRAVEAGMIVMLRAAPRVTKGDPLAAIVDVAALGQGASDGG